MNNNKKDFYWLNGDSRTFLSRGYLLDGVTPEERARGIAERAGDLLGLDWFADKFHGYLAQGCYSLASPVWANFGLERGLPISCFGSYVGDSMDDILHAHAEVGMQTKMGGGTSVYMGDLRPRGAPITNNGFSDGSWSFMRLFDHLIRVVSQGETRRGQCAGYIDIEHGDIEEWLDIRKEGNEIQDAYYGVVVGDAWMEAMIGGDAAKRALWAKVIESRIKTAIPYVIFRDNVARGRPEVYRRLGMDVLASNLCSEIMLPSSPTESFVCCLSSMNLARYGYWRGTDAVRLLTMFLDAVMQEFIDKASGIRFMERPVRFARRHRALGIGVLGWHSLLQGRMIPFASARAKHLNAEIFRAIRDESKQASAELASLYGEPEVMEGTGMRNATTMAVAPTKSSSFILGQVSPSIEPWTSNYTVIDRAKIKTTFRNPALRAALEGYGRDDEATWRSVLERDGSVQHLGFLTDHERAVFRTAREISQLEIVQQAGQRQRFIDQGQSLNLFVDPSRDAVRDINALHIEAWRSGVKSLYYLNGVNVAQDVARDIMSCVSCEA